MLEKKLNFLFSELVFLIIFIKKGLKIVKRVSEYNMIDIYLCKLFYVLFKFICVIYEGIFYFVLKVILLFYFMISY